MPSYDYECEVCGNVQELYHGMNDNPEVVCECTEEGSKARRVILQAPAAVVPPQHQAAGSKLSYYGITDVRTGKGIEKLDKDWQGSGSPGIKIKSPKKSTT